MNYHFQGTVLWEDGIYKINIPFNVWEVCDSQGVLPVEVTISDKQFTCDLEPIGKGHYYIPLTKEIAEAVDDTCEVTFTILVQTTLPYGNSPYSSDNPIRRIDSMKLITQPNDGLCGQTCIAMLAGITLDEACEIMHCRDWQASMGKMIATLDYLGLSHADVIHYTQGKPVSLPKCAILMEKMGRYSHYLISYDGTYFDPTMGILEGFNKENLVGYLEIATV
jgi:hypothetical protein